MNMQETCICIIHKLEMVIQPAILQSFLSYNMQLYTSCNIFTATYIIYCNLYNVTYIICCNLFTVTYI